MSSLKLEKVKKSYGDLEILHGIDLTIEPGEFVVVVGPSGCGKSSLLRMVAGLESISAGQVYIADKLVNNLEPRARNIAMVFQNYALYPHMTVFNNMAYGLKIRKLAKEEISKRVTKAAKILKIDHLLARKPQMLSGGQRQRVAMGRAIVRQPELFLFDEPLSNLDANLRTEMRLEIKKLQQRLKITSLYVTHDQVEAMTMADKVMILNQGSVEQFDTPFNVFNFPSNKFVASFMGAQTMNYLNAVVENKQLLLATGELIANKLPPLISNIGAVEIGFRCEDVQICHNESGLSFRIELIEDLGGRQLLHGKLLEQFDITISYTGDKKLSPNEQLAVKLCQDKLHYFDCQSGKNLREKSKE